ncbi:unnamed protein product [Cladocopium goreaui]|uniref:Protein ABHD13 (Alpha/beta hydrolas e domain-containing protein 13) (Abhydrolase domain-containing protein 13) n=1 Tax=Cladocopium goreaui TaxID=2562237 RepID=A0A9P1CSR2_9DINO|nr:unnamed protein product [Cladocopium goreaui]
MFKCQRPLVLYFHGNAETVDTYLDPEVFHPLQASKVSALVADFRGYGYSTGRPSLATIATDGERVAALAEASSSRRR